MNPKALDHFLASAEHRAFRIAALATRDDQQALDLVQEAMMRLAEKYGDRPESEWPLLFQRILQNAILDHHRRQKVRRAWVSLFGDLVAGRPESDDGGGSEHESFDAPDTEEQRPDWLADQHRQRERIQAAVEDLPLRQQQAFLLRYWEGMDIAQTAQVMGCSEGSVKTHCFRAVKALSIALKDLEPE